MFIRGANRCADRTSSQGLGASSTIPVRIAALNLFRAVPLRRECTPQTGQQATADYATYEIIKLITVWDASLLSDANIQGLMIQLQDP